jgi:integrase
MLARGARAGFMLMGAGDEPARSHAGLLWEMELMPKRTDPIRSIANSPAPRPAARTSRARGGPDRDAPARPRAKLAASARGPQSWKRTLQEIVWAHNDRHARKPKSVSAKTQHERACALFRCFRDLHALGFKIRNPHRLGGRHVAALLADWTADRPRARRAPLSAATVQNELSYLRTFAEWIGKPGLVRPVEAYGIAPDRVARHYAASTDRSWPGHGLDPDALIEQIAREDPWVGAELRVARAFGLRVKEAVMLQPRAAERAADGAPAIAGEPGEWLEVVRGTKGGRQRRVPIDSPAKRAALEVAKALVGSDVQPLGDPARTLKQNLDRLHNLLKKFRVTRAALGVTAHGLRHGYAAERYEAIAGTPAPVRGGTRPAPDADRDARRQVAEELGHGRPAITNAYLGAVRRPIALPPGPIGTAAGSSAEDGAADREP